MAAAAEQQHNTVAMLKDMVNAKAVNNLNIFPMVFKV